MTDAGSTAPAPDPQALKRRSTVAVRPERVRPRIASDEHLTEEMLVGRTRDPVS